MSRKPPMYQAKTEPTITIIDRISTTKVIVAEVLNIPPMSN